MNSPTTQQAPGPWPVELAEQVAERLMQLGMTGCAVRAHATPPKSPTEIRAEAELMGGHIVEPTRKAAFIRGFVDGSELVVKEKLAVAPPPFPHVVRGNADVVHYLRGLTDLLAPGFDDELRAKVGETHILVQSWKTLIVAVALPNDRSDCSGFSLDAVRKSTDNV